ncbi:MAG: DNA polymerase III subunit gamma/tau C-terminal domain-containing protein, partial [Rhodoferax sp.]|nr:DNA polymerase III subunit gamma/tau C-terminal domain-containing protein [Rhodoferax sp.]
KVFMIDEVHMLTNPAFNAMLKTLEEPPDYLKFVLATTDPQKVPVTVLSRCLQFNLRPMAPETIREHLQKVLQAEAVSADVVSLKLLARAARGSMRDALSLADQAIAFGAGELQEALVRQMLGSVDRSYVFRLIDALARGDAKTVVQTSQELRLHGLSAASTLEEMSAVLQRMAVLQAVADAAAGDDNDPEQAELERLAALMPADETQLLYSICLHGRAELGLAPDEYAALTMVLLRLLAFKPGASAGAAAEKKTLKTPTAENSPLPPVHKLTVVPMSVTCTSLQDFKEKQTPEPTQQAQDAPIIEAIRVLEQPLGQHDVAAPSPMTQVPVSAEGDFWYATVQALVAANAIAALVRELALQSQLIARDSDQWLLRVERESLNQGGNRDRLAAALAAAGFNVKLAVEIGRVTDSPARRNAAAAAQAQLDAEKIVLQDPLVQTLMRDFAAKIMPGSIKPL